MFSNSTPSIFRPLFAKRIDIKDLCTNPTFLSKSQTCWHSILRVRCMHWCSTYSSSLIWDLVRFIPSKDCVAGSATLSPSGCCKCHTACRDFSERSWNWQGEPCPVWTVSSRCYLASLHYDRLNHMIIYLINSERLNSGLLNQTCQICFISTLWLPLHLELPSGINCSMFSMWVAVLGQGWMIPLRMDEW